MVPAEVWERTFQLWPSSAVSGVCFAIDVDGRQYAATAAHVVAGVAPDELTVWRNDRRESFGASRIWTAAAADVAVISLGRQLAPPHLTLPLTRNGMVYGQEVYFLGFPFGMRWPVQLHQGQPIPLVKHAVVSGEAEFERGHRVLLLDGHNNPGFSGGPVVAAPGGRGKVQALGIVSGFRSIASPVTDSSGAALGTVLANTGLMVVEPIEVAIEGARALGDGYPITEDGPA